jgi:hypothetical protein
MPPKTLPTTAPTNAGVKVLGGSDGATASVGGGALPRKMGVVYVV